MSPSCDSTSPASLALLHDLPCPQGLQGHNCSLGSWGLRCPDCGTEAATLLLHSASRSQVKPEMWLEHLCSLSTFPCALWCSFCSLHSALLFTEKAENITVFPNRIPKAWSSVLQLFQGLKTIFWTQSKNVARPVFPLISYSSSGKTGSSQEVGETKATMSKIRRWNKSIRAWKPHHFMN